MKRNLKEAVFPGVREIQTAAFRDCKKRKDLWLSKKLNHVEPDAFPKGMKLTNHAPAGRYAEEYAKRKQFFFSDSNTNLLSQADKHNKESQQGICRSGKQSSPDEATLIRTALQSRMKPLFHEVQVNRIALCFLSYVI